MIFILSGIRVLSNAPGVEFINNLREIRIVNDSDYDHFNENTMIMIDLGIEELNAEEVRAYAKYICNIMGYKTSLQDRFYNNLLDYAEHYMPEDLDNMPSSEKISLQAGAIVYLNQLMKAI